MLWQPPLPKRYTNLPDDQLITEIDAQRADLGDQLVILGHLISTIFANQKYPHHQQIFSYARTRQDDQ